MKKKKNSAGKKDCHRTEDLKGGMKQKGDRISNF